MNLRISVAAAALLVTAVAIHGQTPAGSRASSGAKPSGLITGQVIDAETGSPVPAAIVALSDSTQAASRGQSLSRVRTDGQGRFFFDQLAAGTYTVTATKAGWIPGAFGRRRPDGNSHPLELKDEERRGNISIPIWRYGVISGRVADEQGEALIGADVRIFQQTFTAGRPQLTFTTRATTDDRGAFRVATLLPGDYLVVVPATVTAEPPALSAQTSAPNSYLQTMTPVGVAPMSLRRAEIATTGDQTRVSSILNVIRPPSADGAWTTYATTLFPSATSVGSARIVRLAAGQERTNVDVIVRLVPTFQVSGTLANLDGTPAAFHGVHLVPADSGDHPIFDVATAVTDGSGRFAFMGVPPGQFIARVVRTPMPSTPGSRISICGGTGAIEFVCAFSGPPGAGGAAKPPETLLHADQPVTVENGNVSGVAITLRAGARVNGRAEFEGSAPRPTDTQWGGIAVSLERVDGQTFQAQGGFDLTEPGRFSTDGRFTTPSSWPGRYFLRISSPPPGWTFKGATYQGRDISETPFDLSVDLNDVAITFTDRAAKIDGAVQNADGQSDPSALVLLFPTDPAAWVDYGRTSRRVRSASAVGGTFTIPAPPDGDYFLIAVPDDQAQGWQNPAFLEKAAALADRIRIADGQSMTHPLRTKRLQ